MKLTIMTHSAVSDIIEANATMEEAASATDSCYFSVIIGFNSAQAQLRREEGSCAKLC